MGLTTSELYNHGFRFYGRRKVGEQNFIEQDFLTDPGGKICYRPMKSPTREKSAVYFDCVNNGLSRIIDSNGNGSFLCGSGIWKESKRYEFKNYRLTSSPFSRKEQLAAYEGAISSIKDLPRSDMTPMNGILTSMEIAHRMRSAGFKENAEKLLFKLANEVADWLIEDDTDKFSSLFGIALTMAEFGLKEKAKETALKAKLILDGLKRSSKKSELVSNFCSDGHKIGFDKKESMHLIEDLRKMARVTSNYANRELNDEYPDQNLANEYLDDWSKMLARMKGPKKHVSKTVVSKIK